MKKLETYVKSVLKRELDILSKLNKIPSPDLLSDYERTIVYKYTIDGFESVNESLRKLEKLTDYGQYLRSSLLKCPVYKDVCYRTIKCSNSNLLKYKDAFINKSTIIESAFLSCSKSKSLALQFSDSPLFTIFSENGRDIENISAYKYEKEVIFTNDSNFKVLDFQQNQKDRIEIILKQII